MTPAALALAAEIGRSGAIPFRRFMEVALYHPEHGYYRRPRDPFGAAGDYYTAEQMQPVFGVLMRRVVAGLLAPGESTVVGLGAGRGEMRDAFAAWNYVPVDLDRGDLPGRFRGVVFANEFFDALPVSIVVRRRRKLRELLVGGGFRWVEGGEAHADLAGYCEEFAPIEEDQIIEVNLDALAWLDRLAASMETGHVVAIDYGYTAAELPRFPAGTLMSYHRHVAREDVLAEPGMRDITAHVNFTALELYAARLGFERVAFESLAQTLLRAGEPDQFGEALAADSEAESLRLRLQLKTLLFGMGETFRVLILRK
jgi:SAM-dependent MidA family methyltransferase